MKIIKLSIVLCVVIVVASCSTNDYFSNVFNSKPTGYYKVGNPYNIAGRWYTPKVNTSYDAVGVASWYGEDFHKKLTANGEKYDMNAHSGAHKTLPMPSMVRVTNVESGKSMLVRINDRGPYVNDRIIDLSKAVAKELGLYQSGTGKVRVKFDNEATNRMFAQDNHQDYIRPKPHAAYNKITANTQYASKSVVKKANNTGYNPSTWGRHTVKNTGENISPSANGNGTGYSPYSWGKRATEVVTKQTFVQIGAYAEYSNAYQAAKQLESIAGINIDKIRLATQDVYRVRLGVIENATKANKILKQAINLGYKDAIIVTK